MAKDDRAVKLGRLVKEKRLDLGLNRPSFVREMARHGEEITPDYLNKIESGTASLARASLEVRESIRAVLGFNPEEWQQATGLYTTAEQTASDSAPTLPIPPALTQAAKQHGGEFASAAWQRHLADLDFRESEPQTPEDWYFLYLTLSRVGLGPKKSN